MNTLTPFKLSLFLGLFIVCSLAWGSDTLIVDVTSNPDARIKLKADRGSLRIEGQDLDRIQVSSHLAASNFELWIDGQRVPLDTETIGESASSPSLSISVPFWNTLVVESESADVELRGVEGELVRISTGSGIVRLSDTRPGRLEIITVSGDQFIDGGGRSSSRLESVRGSIQARDLRGTVQIQTHDGSIDARASRVDALEVKTVSGPVHAGIDPNRNSLLKLTSHNSDIELTLPDDTPLDARLYSHHGAMETAFEQSHGEADGLRVLLGTGSVQAELLSFSGTLDLRAETIETVRTTEVLVFRREFGQARFANFGFDREAAVSLRQGEYALVSVPISASTLFARARTQYLDEDYGYSVLEVESWGEGLNCFEIVPDYAETSVALAAEMRTRVFQTARQFELKFVECPSAETLAGLREVEPER